MEIPTSVTTSQADKMASEWERHKLSCLVHTERLHFPMDHSFFFSVLNQGLMVHLMQIK